jgi:uncharacterized protein
MSTLLMPKATAVWLVENTSLTFEQIAKFCTLHPLEVKAIADGEAAAGVKGYDSIMHRQLTREELDKAQNSAGYELKLAQSKYHVPPPPKKKGPRYTPLSRRQDRPNAILWLMRSHPELKDAQIMRLVGTTKTTILAIKERTHWQSSTLSPLDPVTLGLCSQLELDMEVNKSAKDRTVQNVTEFDSGQTLLRAEDTTGANARKLDEKKSEELNVDAVFAKLKQLKGSDDED